jgi:hypothetical protein
MIEPSTTQPERKMANVTRAQVNKAIKSLGQIELIKGNGYFYFVGDSVIVDASGVYVNSIGQLTLDQWIAEAKEVISEIHGLRI